MQIHVVRGQQQLGQYSLEQVKEKLANGEFQSTDLGWHDGLTTWQPLSSLLAVATGSPPPVPRPSGLAIASLVLGILGLISCMFGVVFALPALVLGIVALVKINKTGGLLQGRALALAGLIMGGVVLVMMPMMAALAIPGFVKARKQSQGRRVLNDARQMDAAIDQWALERGKYNGNAINTTEAAVYLKDGWKDIDLLGNPYRVSVVGPNQIQISPRTKEALADVGIDWGDF